ncbi:MAG: right-handed parallel beta-helix repeat-containing protein [Bacteroidetes bacterium]|nr:right-handed parallel beta-helix repeat-containing protein [Bacteroidota bacterium]
MKKIISFLIVTVSCIFIFSCNQGNNGKESYESSLTFGPGDEQKIQEALLTLKSNTSITLKEGLYHFDHLSIVGVNHILFQGAGHDKTILDFSEQSTSGEGLRATNVKDFWIDGMTIRESKGDLMKISNSRDIKITNLYATWAKSDSNSGGYAIYPVLCKNVLIENCYVQGSSDAGIYVGQSDSAIVRNSKGSGNVAGCEIENTTHAEVHDNEFYNNTAGVLVFDLADLSQRGGHVKVYNNYLHDNNTKNFAKAGSFGTAWGVGNAPPGSGVVILAASDVEIYNNNIVNNNSASIILASGFSVDDKAAEKISNHYQPISKNIKIHGNTIKMGDAFPAPAYEHHIGQILVATEKKLQELDPSRVGKRLPEIVYDGFNSNVLSGGSASNPDSLCIDQKGDNIFVNADFMNIVNPQKWHPVTDIAPFTCK